jgi:hypothetical protein
VWSVAPTPGTLWLHCCYTVVTLWLHCCYTAVTLLLHCWCPQLLHCCHTIVTPFGVGVISDLAPPLSAGAGDEGGEEEEAIVPVDLSAPYLEVC